MGKISQDEYNISVVRKYQGRPWKIFLCSDKNFSTGKNIFVLEKYFFTSKIFLYRKIFLY